MEKEKADALEMAKKAYEEGKKTKKTAQGWINKSLEYTSFLKNIFPKTI